MQSEFCSSLSSYPISVSSSLLPYPELPTPSLGAVHKCLSVCKASGLGRGSRLKLASFTLPLKLKLTMSNCNPCPRVAAQVLVQALGMGQPGLAGERI